MGSSGEMGLPPGAAPSRGSSIGGSRAGHGGGNSDTGLALQKNRLPFGVDSPNTSVTIWLRTNRKLVWKT